jgi:hypothetical protein
MTAAELARLGEELGLDAIGAELAQPRPRALCHHERRRRHGGERYHAHGKHDRDAALASPHDCSANTRTISSPEESTMRTRTARGSNGAGATAGQAVTHARRASRYCNSNRATPASMG